MRKVRLVATVIAAVIFAAPARAAPGDIDTSFGTSGKVFTGFGYDQDVARALVVQADGKIVVAGYAYDGAGYRFALARHESNGALDAGFGSGGKVTTSIGAGDAFAYAAAIQADGKIVLAGFSSDGTNSVFTIARYSANGSLDTGFGSGGIATVPFGVGNGYAQGVAVQSDGKIVVVGYTGAPAAWIVAVARIDASGALDASFGSGGKVTTAAGSTFSQAYAIALQTDGKIVVSGHSNSGANTPFTLLRYMADGTLDSSFGTGGKVTTAVGSFNDAAFALALQPDGKIIATGSSNRDGGLPPNDAIAVVRYNANGSLDSSFGTAGQVITDIQALGDFPYAAALQPDGKLVVAGYGWTGSNYDGALLRYTAAGALDSTFGIAGKVAVLFGTGDDEIYALKLQANGRILVAGRNGTGFFSGQFALARFNGTRAIRGDIDGDGRSDVLWRNAGSGYNYLYQMNGLALAGEGYLRSVPTPWFIAGVGDFDGDGKADLLWRNASTGDTYIFLMNGTSVVGEAYGRNVPTDWAVAGVADLNGDGKADIVWRNATTGDNYVYFMNGLGIAAEGYLPSVPSPWTIAAIGDHDGDGKADLFWRNTSSGDTYFFLMNGLTIASQGYGRTVPTSWSVIGAGDYNGDGKADLLWRNAGTGDNYLYLLDGMGLVGEGYVRNVPAPWTIVGTGDYDGDGKADVLWRNTSSGEDYLFLMNGLTVTSEGYLPSVPTDWAVIQ